MSELSCVICVLLKLTILKLLIYSTENSVEVYCNITFFPKTQKTICFKLTKQQHETLTKPRMQTEGEIKVPLQRKRGRQHSKLNFKMMYFTNFIPQTRACLNVGKLPENRQANSCTNIVIYLMKSETSVAISHALSKSSNPVLHIVLANYCPN